MNKNLLEQDDNDLLEIQPSAKAVFENVANPRFAEIDDEENLLEIPGLETGAANFSEQPEKANETASLIPSAEDRIEETESEPEAPTEEIQPETRIDEIEEIEEIEENQPENRDETVFQPPVAPESTAETTRKSGLAYGAAVTLFGSIIVMLFLGWLADRLLKTSPWGIIIGILLGAIIGFYQFFKITSSIFKNKD